jgi:hypothetical protein
VAVLAPPAKSHVVKGFFVRCRPEERPSALSDIFVLHDALVSVQPRMTEVASRFSAPHAVSLARSATGKQGKEASCRRNAFQREKGNPTPLSLMINGSVDTGSRRRTGRWFARFAGGVACVEQSSCGDGNDKKKIRSIKGVSIETTQRDWGEEGG